MKPNNNDIIPLEAQYLYRRGREMIDQQKEDVALVYLRQAVFIAPGFSKAYRELGNCLARLGRSEEASAYHLKASRIDLKNCRTVIDRIPLNGQVEDQTALMPVLTCLIW